LKKVIAKNIKILLKVVMERTISEQLVAWKKKPARKPLVLCGARQVGKTYSLLAFGRDNFTTTHYVNFEQNTQAAKIFDRDLNPKRIVQEISFYLDRNIAPDKDLLVFDEIQECPRALTSLKYFQEDMPELAVCAAGSLLGIHLGDTSYPVGKVELLFMYPMSFLEFLHGIHDLQSYTFLRDLAITQSIPEIVHSRLWDRLKEYMVVGGLPEAVKTFRDGADNVFAAMQEVRKMQRDLITMYLADMAKHSGKQNSMHLERLWRNVPAQLAREQNSSAPKFVFKDVLPGVRGYERLAGPIDWLAKAGLIIRTHIVNSGHLPFAAHAKENFFKLYCYDVGLLGALSDLAPQSILSYEYGTYKGYFAENLIAQEFLCAGAGPLYCWRERTAEVEFLREIESEVIPIEVKSGWVTQAKSLLVFAEKYAPPYRVIMSGRSFHVDAAKGIHHYPLFLAGRFPLADE